MDELEGRLQTLTRLSPPTTDELGADVLHERATKVRRRSQLALAVPAAALVVVVLAAALAFRTRTTDETVPAGPPGQVSTGSSSLSARDLDLLAWIDTSTALRDELVFEMLASATYASTNKSNPQALAEQRPKTDAAYAAFAAKTEQVGVTNEAQSIRDAAKQFDNRWRALPIVRRSVDAIQTEATRLIDEYMHTVADLGSMERGLVGVTNDPHLFRSLFNHMNLVAVTNQEARTAALLTIPVEVGFYAATLPTGANPVAARHNALGQGCGDDAASAGLECKLYQDVAAANSDLTKADSSFNDYASDAQKRLRRYADGDIVYDELKRNAIEGGQGHNDLTGAEPGTTAVPADSFRAAARERIAKMSRAERQFLNLVRFPDGSAPAGPDAFPPDFRPGEQPVITSTTAPRSTTTQR